MFEKGKIRVGSVIGPLGGSGDVIDRWRLGAHWRSRKQKQHECEAEKADHMLIPFGR